jgi:hypothetical protein
MAAIKLLLVVFCYAFISSNGQFDGHLLKQTPDDRAHLVSIAEKEIGVRELSGHNDGERVEAYLRVTGLRKGNPWCAAYVSWVYWQAGFTAPASAWSPDLFPASRVTTQFLPGNVLGIYFPELKRIAHVGLIIKRDGDWVVSAEGNTNVSGSRNGDGVYLKRRHHRTIYQVADWVKNGRKVS